MAEKLEIRVAYHVGDLEFPDRETAEKYLGILDKYSEISQEPDPEDIAPFKCAHCGEPAVTLTMWGPMSMHEYPNQRVPMCKECDKSEWWGF